MIPAERLAELKAIAEAVEGYGFVDTYFSNAFDPPTCLSLLAEIERYRRTLESLGKERLPPARCETEMDRSHYWFTQVTSMRVRARAALGRGEA